MEYAPLTGELREQLSRVEPSADHACEYRPCRVRLASGEVRDFVYLVDADAYFGAWGAWPEDHGRDVVSVEDVVAVEESPFRLPAALANRVYSWGETGMGYTVFTVVLRDGRGLPRVTEYHVDFPALPEGVTTSDIVDVLPEGRKAFTAPPRPDEGTAPYAWCLYRSPPTGRYVNLVAPWAFRGFGVAILLVAFLYPNPLWLVVAAALWTVFGEFRLRRVGLVVSPFGLTARRLMHSELFPWETVAGFETASGRRDARAPGEPIHLLSTVKPRDTWPTRRSSKRTQTVRLPDGRERVGYRIPLPGAVQGVPMRTPTGEQTRDVLSALERDLTLARETRT